MGIIHHHTALLSLGFILSEKAVEVTIKKEVIPLLKGGFSSAIISFPISMTYGAIAFAPFGTEFTAAGIVAGLFGAIIASFLLVPVGGRSLLGTGPRTASIVIFAALCQQLLTHPDLTLTGPEKIQFVLMIGFLTMLLAALFQVLIGLLRFGSVVTVIPYSVISGFIDASVLIIIVGQAAPFLGFGQKSFSELPDLLPSLDLLMLLPGLGALAVMVLSKKIVKVLPPPLLGLAGGIAIYQLLLVLFPSTSFGPTLTSLDDWLPTFYFFADFSWLATEDLWSVSLWFVLPAALSMAALSSFDTVFSLSALRELTEQKCNPNRELIAHGFANFGAALAGGLMSSGGLNRTKPALDSGTRSPAYHCITAIFMLLILIGLYRWIHMVPISVIAAIILYVGVNLVDIWIFKQIGLMLGGKIPVRRDIILDFAITLTVIVFALYQNLIVAVGVGTLIAILIFIAKISGNPVKATSRGNLHRSRKVWAPDQQRLLEKFGSKIAILKLHGSLFFGTAQALEDQVDELMAEEIEFLILDLKELKEIDTTGVRSLVKIKTLLDKRKGVLSTSYLKKERRKQNTNQMPERRQIQDDRSIWKALEMAGFIDLIGQEEIFFDTDCALLAAEIRLLDRYSGAEKSERSGLKGRSNLLKNFTLQEIQQMRSFLKHKIYKMDEPVFNQGDIGDGAYFIARGDIDIFLEFDNLQGKKRVQTISEGNFFGEMSLFTQSNRSATAIAQRDTVCFHLDLADYKKLVLEHPQISFKLLNSVCSILANRLQYANNLIVELES